MVNRFGIRDHARLDHTLNHLASAGWAQIAAEPIPQRPDFKHLQHIHQRLFHETLTWAGQVRDTDARAGGTGIVYCRPDYIAPALQDLYRKLDREDYLRDLSRKEFATRLADRWGELTIIHPVMDGNTRSQSVYITQTGSLPPPTGPRNPPLPRS